MSAFDIYKKLTWKACFETGDMPYPPVIFWKDDIGRDEILMAWSQVAQYARVTPWHNMGLYVHIPFCFTRCFYCTCLTKVSHRSEEYDAYLDLLDAECSLLSGSVGNVPFNTVYVGGGTPTILSAAQIDRFYTILKKHFNLGSVVQIMTEGSPYTTTREKLAVLARHGINKMTFGVQSLDAGVLKANNRAQETIHVIDAIRAARELGIQYINVDLMCGIPGQTLEGFQETIRLVEEMDPTTVHINAFIPTRRTLFSQTGRSYGLQEIALRNQMRKAGHPLEEQKHHKHDELLCHNVQLYNAKNFNSSILGVGYGAISHAFGNLHYTKTSEKDYTSWARGEQISLRGYRINHEHEMVAHIANNWRNGVYEQDFARLFGNQKRPDFLETALADLESRKILERGKDDKRGLFFKSRYNSEVLCRIYEKHFYHPEILERFVREFNVMGAEYSDIDFKLKQFFAD